MLSNDIMMSNDSLKASGKCGFVLLKYLTAVTAGFCGISDAQFQHTLYFASLHVMLRRGKQAMTERRGQSFTICDVLQNDKMRRRVLAFENK